MFINLSEKRMLWFHLTARSNSSASSYAPLLPLPACSLISSSSCLLPPCLVAHPPQFPFFVFHLLLPENQMFYLYRPQ